MSTRTSTLDPTVEGVAEIKQSPSEGAIDSYLVTLDPEDDPRCMPTLRRWVAVLVISSASLCVTCASSVAAFTEAGSAQAFHVSHEVTILGISVYVSGLGAGLLLVGPLSEVYGRNLIYRFSYILFFIFTFPVAFASNIGVFLFFRLITGFCGAAFLSVAGGSVSDMFPNSTVASPMAVYTMSPFIGPVLGPLIAGYGSRCLHQNAYWRWTYWFMLSWILVETVLLFLFVPETYTPVILKKKAARLRGATGDASYYAPLEKVQGSLARSIMISCYRPFRMFRTVSTHRILNSHITELLNALLLGILYLAFQAYPVIFGGVHHFSDQMTGLTFLGIGIGMFAALSTQPLWNKQAFISHMLLFAREATKYDGNPPPEVLLIMGQVGGILVPIGLFWLAFTTYPQVHWIAPIIASVPFGSGIYFVFTSTFTYLVTAYRPIAASSMASNSALRSAFAAAFPLFAGAMYDRLGTVGATALLAGLTTIMAPLPFIFYHIGGRLRMKSKFAVH
ncbi:MFS general substrate transporter [Imleria badia]|nr:MFS general substrate transporter [Imleria badia]